MGSRKESIERMLEKLRKENREGSLSYWHFEKQLKLITERETKSEKR